MKKALHILTRPDDKLASEIIARQQQNAQAEVTTIDLTKPSPDYKGLLEKIFTADSIQVW